MNTMEAPVHESAARSSESADLVRGLGPWQTTAVVVSTIIGTGVFLVAAPMARAAGSPGLVFVAWLAGTVIALSGMLCFAELGAARRFPMRAVCLRISPAAWVRSGDSCSAGRIRCSWGRSRSRLWRPAS